MEKQKREKMRKEKKVSAKGNGEVERVMSKKEKLTVFSQSESYKVLKKI